MLFYKIRSQVANFKLKMLNFSSKWLISAHTHPILFLKIMMEFYLFEVRKYNENFWFFINRQTKGIKTCTGCFLIVCVR